VDLSRDLGLIQVHLHVFGMSNFVPFHAIQTDSDQSVAGQNPSSGAGGIWFHSLG
jgi:hypothetical protein